MRCPHRRCSLSHSSALSKISGASWGRGGESFLSLAQPGRTLAEREREKNQNNNNPQNTQRPQNPEKGKALGRRSWQSGESRGEPERGGREGRRIGGGARALREPRQGPQELQNEHHATFPQSDRSPRLPLAPGRPAGPLAGGEELELCLHSPGCRSTEVGEKAGFHLAKNAPRRRGSSPSRPPRLFPRLPPRRISPGRALREGYFFPPGQSLPTRAHRSPAPPLQRPRDGAGQGGGPARLIPAGQNPTLPSLPRADRERVPSPGGPQSTPDRRFFRSLPPKSLQRACKSAERKRQLGPRGRMDLASQGLREGKASPVAALLPQGKPRAVPPLLPGCHQG